MSRKMLNGIFALFVVVMLRPVAWSAPATTAEEIRETLARAEALYYEADFTKSIELLLRVDGLLQTQRDQLPDKISVKLQLALAYIGLNNTSEARIHLRELFELDPDYSIDPQQYSPKVVTLADQAKSEQNDLRCRTLWSDVQQQLLVANAQSVLRTLGSNQKKCTGLAAFAPIAADLFYKEGMDAYRKGKLADALAKFRTAIQLHPEHELASQYMELAENKLQFDADRVLLTWRKNFEARDFVTANQNFRELVSVSSADVANQAREEYRKTLTTLVEAWNRACASNDLATMEKIRQQVNELLPDPSIGQDLLAKMNNCTPAGCLPMTSALALARLRTRVDPDFPAYIRSQIKVSPVTVRMKAKISETGDVVSSEPSGPNGILFGPVQIAFSKWKFTPVIVGGAPRCVETEIPIVINFVSTSK